MTNEPRRPKSLIFLIVSILGTIVFTVFGIYLVAFVILPSLISRDSIKSIIESKLNTASSNNSTPSIAGLPTSEINPLLQRLKDGAMTYQWKTGDVHAYDFSFRLGDEQNKPFKVQGNFQYTIGTEKVANNSRTGEGVGSAFVIAPGYLATSAHVVRIAERITFVLANKRYAAKIVDVDTVNDLAILAYEGEETPVALGSSANVKLAEGVFVLGFPTSADPALDIKVAAGKISNIEESKGGRAISIEGEINNPGNSGGPVVNSNGEVIGLANIASQGERSNPVGFASRVDGLHALMTKNNIAIKPSTPDTTLDSEEIARRFSPHVGRLELSNWVDNRNLEIDFYATYDGSIKSPVVIYNGVRKEGLSGKMLVSRLGELRSISDVEPLPFVLASIPELILQPFDLATQDKWLMYRNYQIDPPQRAAPGLMRPKMRDRFMGPAERQPGIPAVLESEYEVVSSDQDVIRIKKTRRFQMPTDKPSLEVHGEGVWEFDTKQGLPISLEENLTVSNNANGKTTETPLSYKVTRVDPTLVQERVRLAQELAEKQKKEQEIEQTQPNPALIDELVLQISSKDAEQRFSALNRLARIAIVEDKRDSTLKSLRAVIAGKDSIMHSLGWPAYMHWMNPACAPELRRIIGKSPTHRKAALNALFELKLEEDLPIMIENLSSLSYDAQKSLSSFGPKVESVVLEKLLTAKDNFAQIDLIRLLQEVGTQHSIDKLTELSSTDDLGMKIRMESAIAIIKSRLERNPTTK